MVKRTYIIWGGLFGWDGILTSRGLTTLENQLSQYGPVKSYLQSSAYRCADDIYNECAADDICVLGGYSGGSVEATRICVEPLARKEQRIDLLFNMDGSPKENMMHVGLNVKKILNTYNPNATWPGGGRAVGRVDPMDRWFEIGHLRFQYNQGVRDIICKAVADL